MASGATAAPQFGQKLALTFDADDDWYVWYGCAGGGCAFGGGGV